MKWKTSIACFIMAAVFFVSAVACGIVSSGGDGVEEPDFVTAQETAPVLINAVEAKGRTGRDRVSVAKDEFKRRVDIEGGRYSLSFSYDKRFVIDSLIVDGLTYVTPADGFYTGLKSNGTLSTSLKLMQTPVVEVKEEEDGCTVTVAYTESFASYVATITARKDYFTLKIDRTMLANLAVSSQSFPRMLFEQDAIENIRWSESGSNFWVDGEGNDLTNFLSAEKYNANNNVLRAMDEINFVLLSSFDNSVALKVEGISSADGVEPVSGREHARGRATEVDRIPNSDDKYSLSMNVNVSAADTNLRYSSGNPDFGWSVTGDKYTGSIAHTGAETVFQEIRYQKDEVSTIELRFTPDEFAEHFDLGVMYGIDEQSVSEAINSFARIMLLGKNTGSAQEFPNIYIELPALQMHWNTNFASIFGDQASMNTQKWALINIKNFLQKENGHIRSPYPGVPGDSWGSKYPSMQSNYVTAICDYYAMTGDRIFLDEMHDAATKSLQYFHEYYYDAQAHLVINPVTENENLAGSYNDYWEKSVGKYNALLTAEYYEALVKLADVEELVYQDADQAKEYRDLAAVIKQTFNRDKADGGCFVPETQSFYYGSANENVTYLPVQALAIRCGIADGERAVSLARTVERYQSNYNMGYHVMNVRDLRDARNPAPQSGGYNVVMVGENGGWYGAPDGEWFAALVKLNDRGLIPYYINKTMEKFRVTGFTGATTYLRDGVTPADDGWWECMPNMAYSIWGLYTYGYGFQPGLDGLTVAPFLDESMVGSKVNYLFRGSTATAEYHSLFSFTLDYAGDAPVFAAFVNQTPGRSYRVSVNGSQSAVTADAEGTVRIALTGDSSRVELLDPDSEHDLAVAEGVEDVFGGDPVRPSSTYLADLSTKYWAEQLTDGSLTGFWAPDPDDREPSLTVVHGRREHLSYFTLYTAKGHHKFIIEGSDSLYNPVWTSVCDRSLGTNAQPGEEGYYISVKVNCAFRYYRVRFLEMDAAGLKIYGVSAK